MNDLLRWADGRLLLRVFGELDAAGVQRLRALGAAAPLCCVQVLEARDTASAVEHVRDPQGHLRGASHVAGHTWALVRPDSYVAATGEAIDAVLVHAISQTLGAHGEDA